MVAANRVRAAGWSVAVIDFRPFGGTCALRGCDPKNMFIGGVSAFDHTRRMRGKGVTGDVKIDWPALVAFERSFTDPVPKKQEKRYAEKGVDTYHGRAKFTDRTTLDVEGEKLHARATRAHCSGRGADPTQHSERRAPSDERRIPVSREAAATHRVGRRRLYCRGVFQYRRLSKGDGHDSAAWGADAEPLRS